MIVQHGQGQTLRGLNAAEDFTLSLTARRDLITPGGSGLITIKDTAWNGQAEASYDDGFLVNFETLLGSVHEDAAYDNLSPAVCTLANQSITRIADGIAQIQCTHGTTKRCISQEILRHDGAYCLESFQSHTAGSLAAAIDAAIDAAINNKTASPSNQRLLSPDASRNPDNFLANYDLTGINAYVDATGQSNPPHALTLISPRHAIAAAHFTPYNCDVTWIDATNTPHSAQIAGSVKTGNDINVVILNADIPNCKAYKLPPATFAHYLPEPQTSVTGLFTALGTENQSQHGLNKSAYLADYYTNGGNATGKQPIHASRQGWYQQLYHSGSPLFIPVMGELVLLCTWWMAYQNGSINNNYVFGESLHHHIANINAAMTSLTNTYNPGGTNHQTTLADLSSYTSFA